VRDLLVAAYTSLLLTLPRDREVCAQLLVAAYTSPLILWCARSLVAAYTSLIPSGERHVRDPHCCIHFFDSVGRRGVCATFGCCMHFSSSFPVGCVRLAWLLDTLYYTPIVSLAIHTSDRMQLILDHPVSVSCSKHRSKPLTKKHIVRRIHADKPLCYTFVSVRNFIFGHQKVDIRFIHRYYPTSY